MTKEVQVALDRRRVLALLGSAAATFTTGCGSSKDITLASSAGSWATGGTAAMTAKGSYPDPFARGLSTTCAITCAITRGPCHARTIARRDISEGHDGLPLRLSLLVVDETCKRIQGADVDIWHTAPEGLYSGDDALDLCTRDDARARAARWFRGVQTTDAKGRVDFDTCFPGWYPGRTIHIHFTIRIGNVEYVTSQLFFTDALDDEIINTQPLYKDRGPRDTTNRTDIIDPSAMNDYILQVARMPDGAMQAWKTLVIRSSLSSPLCRAPSG